MSHFYFLYGLSLQSNRAIPGLQPSGPIPSKLDLTLCVGERPEQVDGDPGRVLITRGTGEKDHDPAFVLKQLQNGAYHELSYADGTRFWIDSTIRHMWGCFVAPQTIEDLSTYLLGPVMGYVLRRRTRLTLHASVVAIGDVAVAFCGPAGAGKSTTAAAMALRGYPVLCEDVAPLRLHNGSFLVEPGYPRVCLWGESVTALLGSREALPRLTPTWDKQYLPLDGTQATFCQKPLALGVVYLLADREGGNAPRIEEMTPKSATLSLVQDTYMNFLLTREQRANEFDAIGRLVQRVPVRRLIPHEDTSRIENLCAMIVRDAGALTGSTPTRRSLRK